MQQLIAIIHYLATLCVFFWREREFTVFVHRINVEYYNGGKICHITLIW